MQKSLDIQTPSMFGSFNQQPVEIFYTLVVQCALVILETIVTCSKNSSEQFVFERIRCD